MNIFYELYLDIIFKGNYLIRDKKYIPDYFKFIMGIIAGIGLNLFIFTDYTTAALVLVITTYLLFYFVKENLEANPTLVLSIDSEKPTKEFLQELEKHLRNK